MATHNQLEQFAAGSQAFESSYANTLADEQEAVLGLMVEAQTGLTAGMLAVAEACGLGTDQKAKLTDTLNPITIKVVSDIYQAAIREIRKEQHAKELVQAAAEHAEVEVREQQTDAAIERWSQRSNNPGWSRARGDAIRNRARTRGL